MYTCRAKAYNHWAGFPFLSIDAIPSRTFS